MLNNLHIWDSPGMSPAGPQVYPAPSAAARHPSRAGVFTSALTLLDAALCPPYKCDSVDSAARRFLLADDVCPPGTIPADEQ